MTTDAHWMSFALEEARLAGEAGEVPVGAILVKDGAIVATGRNCPVTSSDPCAHAEIHALRAGAALLGNYRLDGCELFVTLEPCAMCAGAILHARIARVVYGARDPKTGAAGSVLDLFALPRLNHHTRVQGGVLEERSAGLLQSFFQARRDESRRRARPLRHDGLRAPSQCFAGLTDWACAASWSKFGYVQNGWRMHWLDSSANGFGVFRNTVICLHGPGQWSYLFRHLMAVPDIRWLAPDLVGFGKSDKPKRASVHSWGWHCETVLEWLDACQSQPVRIVHAASAMPLVELLLDRAPHRFATASPAVVPDDHAGDVSAAWRAPFPDRGHEAALIALGRGDTESSGPTLAQATEFGQALRS